MPEWDDEDVENEVRERELLDDLEESIEEIEPVRCSSERMDYACERLEGHDGMHAQISGEFLAYWTESSRGVTLRK